MFIHRATWARTASSKHRDPEYASTLIIIDAPFVKADKRPRPSLLDPHRAPVYPVSDRELMSDEAGR